MTFIFWLSFATLIYVYVGYPALVWVLARLFGKEPHKREQTPEISLLIPAYNEEDHIEAKLTNALALDYPKDRLEIVVASDGSTDRTHAIVEGFAREGVKLVQMSQNVGKSAMLNHAVPLLKGQIVVFSDASSELEPDALRKMVRNFSDPAVGCVSGLYRLMGSGDLRAQGEGLYWKYETFLKRQESRLHSILGAHGAFYGIRKELFRPLGDRAINDDYLIPMRVVEQGYRAVYEPAALAWERDLVTVEGEFARRRRIAAGNCQQVVRLFPMLNPLWGWVAFSFFSHKVLRTMSPLLMVGMLVATASLPEPFKGLFFLLQGILYLAAGLGYLSQRFGRKIAWLAPAYYFCLGNLATLVGLFQFCFYPQSLAWGRARSS